MRMLPAPIRSIARLIDHALLHPTLTDTDLRAGCQQARQYEVASVCIKPYAVPLTAMLLAGSDVQVGTVVGFPHGSNTIASKVAETRQACQEGATEIDMVINIGKALSSDWVYLTTEIQRIQPVCTDSNALLKVIFETDFLPNDTTKIQLCTICTEVGVAFVKTSTGFGFVKGPNGLYDYKGATEHDLRLMLAHVGPGIQVKASGGIRTFDDVMAVQALGVTRIGTSSTASIMAEAYRRYALPNPNLSGFSAAESTGY